MQLPNLSSDSVQSENSNTVDVSVLNALEPSREGRTGLFEYRLPLIVISAELDILLMYLTLKLNQVLFVVCGSYYIVKSEFKDNFLMFRM